MLHAARIAKKIHERLAAWQRTGAKLIIGIDGYAGAGKSTVADALAAANTDVLVVHLDDFIQPLKIRKRLMERAADKAEVFERK